MKIYTSYFYQVRFFQPWEVPLSTAVWDPKWYHDFQGQDKLFMDKRGVLNGCRAEAFVPDKTCSDLCRGLENCVTKDPKTCEFLRNYRRQLDKLNCDKLVTEFGHMSDFFMQQLGLERPADFILLLHEAPSKTCSERGPIQAWFRDNGHPIEEWQRHS